MAILTAPICEEVEEAESSENLLLGELEEHKLEKLAFEFWQMGSCPEMVSDEDLSDADDAVRGHSSCL